MRPLDSPKLPLKARKPLAGTTDARAPGSDAFASRLDEADKTLEKVRSLHESYFLGLEKRAPEPERLDLQRRLNDLRRQGTSNTALRFRLESLVQRHIVLSSYWTRTLREIEAGTYRRDVFKANRHQAERAVHTAKAPADPPAPVTGQRPPPPLGDRPSPAPPAALGNRAPPPPATPRPAAPPRGAPPPIPADAVKRAAAAAIMSKASPAQPVVRPPAATVPPSSGKR